MGDITCMENTRYNNNQPTVEAMQNCQISRERINAMFEAHGIDGIYNALTPAERKAIRKLQDSIPNVGASCWMNAFIALWQWHNGINQ